MGRHRGSKFSFPIPGRKSHVKEDNVDSKSRGIDLIPAPAPSISSMASIREHPLRYDDSSNFSNPSNLSKAQRVLGTAGPPFRPGSKQANLAVPPSPGYMSVTISDTGSDYDGRTDDGSLLSPSRPDLSNRASSNIQPPSIMAYNGSERPGSVSSSFSRHLRPRASDSTMRSHYDARSSPLAISQQTSDSAVRDMALRKGKPQVLPYGDEDGTRGPSAQASLHDAKGGPRKSRPPRLDISKLFPKPRSNGAPSYENGLLSPNKMMNSPTALSTMSDHFPRPMTREPTPQPRGLAKLTKSRPQQQSPPAHPGRSLSPSRLYKRDTYDSAKINVRRPPHGIKHWFDGLDEESDETDEEQRTPVQTPTGVKPSGQHFGSLRKSSVSSMPQDRDDIPKSHQYQPSQSSRAAQHMLDPRKTQPVYPNPLAAIHLSSPSQYSLQSQTSQATTKTRDSSLSKTNLQKSSVLSFSSSEDEDESSTSTRPGKKVTVRDSIDMSEDNGDIVIGQAQAFPMRPTNNRRPSAGKLSMLSTSTNAATIEVMYTPEPSSSQQFPRFNNGSRKSSHARQPSVIREGENEDARPKTAPQSPQSPSSRSIRTSTSEPRSRAEAQKFMAVTPEEEALLEALRKKRAAMAQQSFVEGYHQAIKREEVIRQTTPPESQQKSYRTSAFLSLDSPSHSPVRVVETKKKQSRKPLAPLQTPLLAEPPRGRSVQGKGSIIASSILRDSSSCDPTFERHVTIDEAKLARRLSPPPEFSPLDPFPSPTHTTSIVSPTTTLHPSPLPSPITPGLRNGETEVLVKVVSSEPSCHSDNDDVDVLETGVIDKPAGSIKPEEPRMNHRRRRTASSGTDAPMPLLPKASTKDSRDRVPVSVASSRTSSVVEPTPPQPKVPKKSSLRQSSISISTTGLSSSKHNSIASIRTSSPVRTSYDRRSSRAVSRIGSMSSMKRDSVATLGANSTRCSVSEDVLAAWGSLGGNYDRPRY